MLNNVFQILIPIICLSINIIIQIFTVRTIPRLGLLRSVFLGFCIGFIFAVFFQLYGSYALSMIAKDYLSIFAVNSIIYLALSYCYFTFINLGETARRIRIIRELFDSKSGLSAEAILERYNAKKIVNIRIKRLLDNSQILHKNDRYYIRSPLMLLIAKIIVALKLMLLGKKGEFD